MEIDFYRQMLKSCEARPSLSGALFLLLRLEKFNLLGHVIRNERKKRERRMDKGAKKNKINPINQLSFTPYEHTTGKNGGFWKASRYHG